MKSKKKTQKTVKKTKNTGKVEIRLIFDDKKAADQFIGWWLDGGGDGGGNLNWNTDYKESDDWTKKTPNYIRIKGDGKIYEPDPRNWLLTHEN